MYCKSCGNQIADEAVVCPKCGIATTISKQDNPLTRGREFNSYLVFSIIVACCCCQPLGIVSIVFSVMANSHHNDGKECEADKYAKYALWSAVAGVVLGILTYLIVALLSLAAEE